MLQLPIQANNNPVFNESVVFNSFTPNVEVPKCHWGLFIQGGGHKEINQMHSTNVQLVGSKVDTVNDKKSKEEEIRQVQEQQVNETHNTLLNDEDKEEAPNMVSNNEDNEEGRPAIPMVI